MRRARFDQFRRLPRRFGVAELLAGLGVLALLALLAREIDRRWTVPEMVAGFGEAIDGDSLRVAGREIRLKGIDAPEISQYCKNRVGRDYACGVEAKRWLNARLQRGAVSCRIEGHDRYGRMLGVCSRGDEVLNDAMVREGIAVDFGGYRSAEAQAQRQMVGLWSGKFVLPADYRAANLRH
jgi:endonuclease YncB( thermonuclease family)